MMHLVKSKILGVLNGIKKLHFVLTKSQRLFAFLVFILSGLSALVQLIGISIIVPAVSVLMDKQSVFKIPIYGKILTFLGITSDREIIFSVLVSVVAIYLVKEVVCVVHLWVSCRYSCKIQRELAIEIITGYMNRTYDFFLNYGMPSIIRDVQDDSSHVSTLINSIISILTESMTMSLIILYVIVSDGYMALFILGISLLCLAVVFLYFRRKVKTNGIKFRGAIAENQKILMEMVGGIKEVQVMRKQSYYVDRFRESYYERQKPSIVVQVASTTPAFFIEGSFVIGMISFVFVRLMINPGYADSIPTLASFMLAAIRLLPSLGRISSSINGLTFYIPSLESVYKNVYSFRSAEKINDAWEEDETSELTFNDSLRLESVCWRYSDAKSDVLNSVNFTLKKGTSVGIIGKSGAGKTTFADVILGLHIPQEGKIYIDDIDVLKQKVSYSKLIGYVPQSIYLVDGSIRENVAFGLRKAEIRDDIVIESLKRAQLYDIVINLENGIDTIIGERGVRLSGGQRQRLAIARALYRQPQILVLDEATSALDSETEAAVMEAIERLQGTVTMLVIAHRVSTVKKCDRVYEVTNGNLIERNRDNL